MIVSVSRRCDIPAFFADWFWNRLDAGEVLVRNPMHPHRVSRIALTPDVVDGFVFWTKNPLPMMDRLGVLEQYPYYFQFTLTPYDTDVEAHLPPKQEVLIPAFRRLSSMIGRERVIWRYDPILICDWYPVIYHINAFRTMCDRLAGYTDTCIISFLDLYRNIGSRIRPLGIRPPDSAEREEIACRFAEIARDFGISVNTCAEDGDYSRWGIGHGACIDAQRLSCIGGIPLSAARDKNQRPFCGCAEAVDIGAYHTCANGCVYCYANHSRTLTERSIAAYDPASPILCSQITAEDVIYVREMRSCRVDQMALFE
ncbi:MAG: DUF1848 domain-containing protein [Ruminococcaceae bacterium]|nr:DUF1848 domain-containing protein [Oscillospiraceae bacterium]